MQGIQLLVCGIGAILCHAMLCMHVVDRQHVECATPNTPSTPSTARGMCDSMWNFFLVWTSLFFIFFSPGNASFFPLQFYWKYFRNKLPDPINHIYSLTGKYISKNCFTSRSVQICKIGDLFSRI